MSKSREAQLMKDNMDLHARIHAMQVDTAKIYDRADVIMDVMVLAKDYVADVTGKPWDEPIRLVRVGARPKG